MQVFKNNVSLEATPASDTHIVNKAYLEDRISKINVQHAIKVDELPICTDNGDGTYTVAYVKDGTTKTTTDTSQWFYYLDDNGNLKQTIFLDGEELTIDGAEIALDDYVEKSAIVTTLDDTVTDEQVPSALATYNMVKDKNLKTYSDFSQISSTATTLSEYIQAMPNNSIASLNIAAHTSEFMGDTEGIINNGGIVYGTLFIQKINAGRIYLRFNQIGAGYYKGTFESTCTATANYELEWRKVLVSEDKYSHITLSSNNADKFMIDLNVLTLPLGEYQISSASFGKTLVNLPPSSTSDIAGRLSVQSLSSSKSEINMLYTTTYTYRTFIYHNLDGNSWIRIVNSGGTVGVFEKDTGWQRICTTNVADIKVTSLVPANTTNYSNADTTSAIQSSHYCVKNGICTMNIGLTCTTPSTSFVTLFSGLPKPKAKYTFRAFAHDSTNGITQVNINITPNGAFLINGGKAGCVWYTANISYPVADN